MGLDSELKQSFFAVVLVCQQPGLSWIEDHLCAVDCREPRAMPYGMHGLAWKPVKEM